MIKFMWLIKMSWKLTDSNRQSLRMRCVSHYTELPNKKGVLSSQTAHPAQTQNNILNYICPRLGIAPG